MPLSRRFLLAGLISLLLGLAAGSGHAQTEGQAPLQTFEKSSLVIDTAQGPKRFSVEMAITPQQQEQGLMYRRSMAADAGMLFVFPATQPTAFWMRNTFIPLDMLFIAANGRIVDIHERAVPLSETVIPSRVPVHAVLELNGGTVARLGIKDGDAVYHPAFGTGGE